MDRSYYESGRIYCSNIECCFYLRRRGKATVTLYGKDDGSGVAGYYVGQQDPQQTDVAFSDSTADTFSGSVTASGTWYFAVKDAAGNITVKSKDYCKISFGLKAGESVNPGCVVIEKGTSVYLPIPDKSGYAFMGWSATQDPTDTGALFTTMTADEDTEIYPYFVDNIKPTFTVKATPGSIGYSGALSFENVVETGSGIAGYYIGQKNPASENVTYGSTTSVTVNRSGVWYLAIKDNAGNVAVEQRAYYLLALNADGATNYTSNSAYIKANTAVTLPTGLTKSGIYGKHMDRWNPYNYTETGYEFVSGLGCKQVYLVLQCKWWQCI